MKFSFQNNFRTGKSPGNFRFSGQSELYLAAVSMIASAASGSTVRQQLNYQQKKEMVDNRTTKIQNIFFALLFHNYINLIISQRQINMY